ncbi:capon-like protein isoform X2 [Vespula maculifrons]|uniref:Capon-like protein isoform X2 n=1 Tax=Vespula maculifrons TaxID=7453 RepID=A0ABD2C3V7_VESMC
MKTDRVRSSNQLSARLDERDRMKLGEACPLRSSTISCIMTSTIHEYRYTARRPSTVESSSTPRKNIFLFIKRKNVQISSNYSGQIQPYILQFDKIMRLAK